MQSLQKTLRAMRAAVAGGVEGCNRSKNGSFLGHCGSAAMTEKEKFEQAAPHPTTAHGGSSRTSQMESSMSPDTARTRVNKRRSRRRSGAMVAASPAQPAQGLAAQRAAPQLLALAASTGGPAAIQAILLGLGGEFRLPTLVAQHIAQGFV